MTRRRRLDTTLRQTIDAAWGQRRRRRLTLRRDAVSMPRTWREIAPGAYLDHDGTLHLVVEELLNAAGVTDTKAHRRMVVAETRRILRRDYPDIEIIIGG